MPAPVSIIIPTSEAASELPACLESLLPGLEAGLIREVIVADGGSADATRAIAGATGAVLVDCERGRAKQLRAGAAAARGEWLLFLYPSVVLVETEARHAEGAPFTVFRFLEGLGYTGCFLLGGQPRRLSGFSLAEHQRVENVMQRGKLYINNFIFF